MMIGVTKWPYDQASIDKRQNDCDYFGDPSDDCKNEAWFIRELSNQLEEKFQVERNLTFAFMDSFSQSGPNLNDQTQQSYWIRETMKLWNEATGKNETFDFKTIDEVLEENAECKEENRKLNQIIQEDIKQLKENVTSLGIAVESNSASISENINEITQNSGSISANTDRITNVAASLSEEINEVAQQCTMDMSSISSSVDENSNQISNLFQNFISLTSSYQKHDLQIMDISKKGRWCGAQDQAAGTITYDQLFMSETNMDIESPPLDIATGKYLNININFGSPFLPRNLHSSREWDLPCELQSDF